MSPVNDFKLFCVCFGSSDILMRVLGNLLYCDIEGHFRGSSRLSLRGDTGGWNSWKFLRPGLYY